MSEPSRPQQVDLRVPWSTLAKLAVFGAAVVLVVVALDVLLSIFVAVVLALGLDPVVAALVRRGWKRGRAALAVFAALFLGVAEAALLSEQGSAADTVRKIHRAVLDACDEQLQDDATVVCLAAE